MLFIDFRQLTIKSERDVDRIKAEVERRVRPLGHSVYAIVNYRGCRIDPAVFDSYRRMVEGLEADCYLGVTRYGMSNLIMPAAKATLASTPRPTRSVVRHPCNAATTCAWPLVEVSPGRLAAAIDFLP